MDSRTREARNCDLPILGIDDCEHCGEDLPEAHRANSEKQFQELIKPFISGQ